MNLFVSKDSIVRQIWGCSDTILFIFAGASAEFALNKAVDWLYFTGKLPADPLGRLFSTVEYARKIVFAPEANATQAIDTIAAIHKAVEEKRGGKIPDWAYRDVLFMLIYYSITAHELLYRALEPAEKHEVYDVFRRVGARMELQGLPEDYTSWLQKREHHLHQDLQNSDLTTDLFAQYKKHLGPIRYALLLEGQKLVVPAHVASLLGFGNIRWLKPSVPLYKLARQLNLDSLVKHALLPSTYKSRILALDM
jgi:hypothetical protein